MSWRMSSLALAFALGTTGCARSPVPSVDIALRDYARAAKSGDAEALYGMLRREDRESLGRGEVAEIVKGERKELAERGDGLAKSGLVTKTEASVRFEDGELVGLALEDRGFRVAAGGTLPGGATTPEGALGDLRRALLRRQYGGILRILAPSIRRTLEADLRSLADGLEHPETLPLQVKDDRAEVKVTGGHLVRLKRAGGGIWYVDYFD